MRIVIDLQGSQSESRFRGIGRYSLSLALAMARNAGEHEILLALNGAFVETVQPIKETFEGLLPQENIHIFNIPTPIFASDPSNKWRAEAASRIREAAIGSLNPDIVHISSLFEGWGDDVAGSIASFDDTQFSATTLYDLIPLLNKEAYLQDKNAAAWYFKKLEYLKKSDILLAISESSKKEAIEHLGIDASKIQNISAGKDDFFYPVTLAVEEKKALRAKFGIAKDFILYVPGGFDSRKNFENLLSAFALLPESLRAKYQLVIAGRGPDDNKNAVKSFAAKLGVHSSLVLTGYVSHEELRAFYSSCELFVFASTHEGFGLPLLEAMGCGAPAIGSNATSIPEVIGLSEALFDPLSPDSIASKMTQVLNDDEFRSFLINHSIKQSSKFTWDASAKKAIEFFENSAYLEKKAKHSLQMEPKKPKMAYLSPLPPIESGISTYSFRLLLSLAKYYDIEIISGQESVDNGWISDTLQIRTAEWFVQNRDSFDRVLYHIGNSHYHGYMFWLLGECPGVVMLHDFFISGAFDYLERAGEDGIFLENLYRSHGFGALAECKQNGVEYAKTIYPMNFDVFSNSIGVLAHSEYSKAKAKEFYGADDDFVRKVPFVNLLSGENDGAKARERLKFSPDDFVVCSFGMIHPTKQNVKLLEAWLLTDVAYEPNAYLVFVGKQFSGDYGRVLNKRILESGLSSRIFITDYVSEETYRDYLSAADITVQLRTKSRGETSGAVYDSIAEGKSLIINAHGTMGETPDNVCLKISDEFEIDELKEAISKLSCNKELRAELSKSCKEFILAHTPDVCAKAYMEEIESLYAQRQDNKALLESIAAVETKIAPSDKDLSLCAKSIFYNSKRITQKQLLVDVSAIVLGDLKTGIQRVVRAELLQLLRNPLEGYRVEPVYDIGGHYKYAREYALSLLDSPSKRVTDDIVAVNNGDIFFGLDFFSSGTVKNERLFMEWRNMGVETHFVVYDLLPIFYPQYFMPRADETHIRWLNSIVKHASSFVCISASVANELGAWLKSRPDIQSSAKIGWFHLGADVENSVASFGLPDDFDVVSQKISSKNSFLTVGTLEPRKGQGQILAAFEALWDRGIDINLVIVGKHGWMVDELAKKLKNHAELGNRLFWLESISDEYLEKIYSMSTCLIAASEGEGFGLPLIEAAQRKLPIIARDIDVFREVAQNGAYYFQNSVSPIVLADSVAAWLELYKEEAHPKSQSISWITWEESASQIKDWLYTWRG